MSRWVYELCPGRQVRQFHEVSLVDRISGASAVAVETEKYAKELSNILSLVEQINEANTKDITPMAHPLEDIVQRLREDLLPFFGPDTPGMARRARAAQPFQARRVGTTTDRAPSRFHHAGELQ